MNDLATYEGLAAVSSMKARCDAVDWKDRMLEIAAAPKTRRVVLMKLIAERDGVGFGTVRNRFYRYERGGDAALVDRRRVKRQSAANPWLECYMTYIENDLNTSKNGYRQMMADFRSGRAMVGTIGTWRDVWRAERPGVTVPEECPLDWTPHGATYANLQSLMKRDAVATSATLPANR